MIRFSCPVCSQHFAVADKGAGFKMACSVCGQRVQIPGVPLTASLERIEAEPTAGQSPPLLAFPYTPEPDRSSRYVLAAVVGVVGLKLLALLIPVVFLILLFYVRLHQVR